MTNSSSMQSNDFVQNATIAIQDIHLQTALDRSLGNAPARRLAAWNETTDPQALRQQGRNGKLRALRDLPEMLEMLEAKLIAKDITVLWAADGAECNQHVIDIAQPDQVGVARLTGRELPGFDPVADCVRFYAQHFCSLVTVAALDPVPEAVVEK